MSSQGNSCNSYHHHLQLKTRVKHSDGSPIPHAIYRICSSENLTSLSFSYVTSHQGRVADSIPARLITHQPGSRPSRGPSAARSWCPCSGSEAWWRPPPGTTSSRCWLPIPAAPGRWLQRRCSAMSGPSCCTRSLPQRRGGHEGCREGASGSWWLKISVVWNKKNRQQKRDLQRRSRKTHWGCRLVL